MYLVSSQLNRLRIGKISLTYSFSMHIRMMVIASVAGKRVQPVLEKKLGRL
jgi:hypothetical protein